MFTLDTNILIYYAAGEEKVVTFLLKHLNGGTHLVLPTIAVVEFFSYPLVSSKDKKLFDSLLPSLDLYSLDFDIAQIAASLRAKYNIKLGDSVVAATAIMAESILVTRNIHDFKKIESLKLKFL